MPNTPPDTPRSHDAPLAHFDTEGPSTYWVQVPSNCFASQGLHPGDGLELKPCSAFVVSGLYLMDFGGHLHLYLVSHTPNGGYACANDYAEFFADPDPTSETGWRERGSGLAARFS